MQGFFEANDSRRIHCTCPQGHIIFPQGIVIKALYKNHNGITIHKAQHVEWEKSNYKVVHLNRFASGSKLVDNQTKQEFPLHALYQLTEDQTKQLNVKCPICFPFVKK